MYTPYGLCTYYEKEPEKRIALAANMLRTEAQKKMLRKITDKKYIQPKEYEDTNSELANKTDTLRGKKCDFIIKIMKPVNSTDQADIAIYCQKHAKDDIRKTWEHIHRNTSNLQSIIQAAASDLNVQTKVTPIWEQIREKKDYFKMDTNRYWSVQKSIDIYECWCKHHNFNPIDFGQKTFEVCHKIRPKKNGLHITGPTNSGKSYILRSIRNGLMNCGRMRCQASDNFTFGTCADKTLIYTDELWFTPQNVEEAKCILEGTETYVNVKHQNERLLKRTPCLSTSNDDPWRHVQGDKEAMQNRMYIYNTQRSMPQLEEWGVIELNPTVWLTVWRKFIDDYTENKYETKSVKKYKEPTRSSNLRSNGHGYILT